MDGGAVELRKGEAEVLHVMGGEVRFLCGAEQTGRKWSLMECLVPKDMGPPLHEHPWDEAYYILEGEVRFEFKDRAETYTAGDFVYAPASTPHGFRGVSAKDSRILIFDAPAHTENFFREVDREVKEMPRDLPKVLEIGARNKIHFHPK